MTKPGFLVGVIGHVDHGKTALVKALTGQDTDRLPEERARGISIVLGFAHLETGHGTTGQNTTIDFIDMPGHERFVRTMISGATGMDVVLLVVSAQEGIKPQTREHIDIASLLGLTRAVIAISKADLVPADQARAVGAEASALLAKAGLAAPPPILTSTHTGTGLTELREVLATLAQTQPPRASDGIPYLPIDRAFAIAGHGPVVTGMLRGGSLTTGDTLELLPARTPVRIRALQIHGAKVDSAHPGQRVAVNLRGVEIGDLHRGMALAQPQALDPSDWLTLSLTTVATAPQLKNGMRLTALFGTAECEARLRLLEGDTLEPGQTSFVQLHLDHPVALPAGEAIILRRISPAQTIAGGHVLEPVTRRARRRDAAIVTRLTQLRDLAPQALIAAEVERAGTSGVPLTTLSRLTALSLPALTTLLQSLPIALLKSGHALPTAALDRLLTRIPARLLLHREGLTQTRLRGALPGVSTPVLEEALSQLLTQAKLVKRGAHYLLPRPEEDQARAQNEAEIATKLAEILQAAGLSPLTPKELLTTPATRRAADRLLREGILIRATDRAKGKEILFHAAAVAAARACLEPLLANAPDGLTPSEIATALGISRKFAMPLVDHLDTIRFTRRVGDRRVAATKGSE